MTRVRPNALAWLALSVLVIAIDQWSKHWVLASLPEYTAVPVIDGFWNWYRTYNTGAAFSFLADAGAETTGIGEQDVHPRIIRTCAAACRRTGRTARCRWRRRPPRSRRC